MRISITSLIFIITLFCGCAKSQCKLSIAPISVLNYVDTFFSGSRTEITKGTYFLIKQYADNLKCEAKIDVFIKEFSKKKDLKNYSSFTVTFYKESHKTTIENILQNKKVIDRYSNQNDLIYQYVWNYGKFLGKFKFKKGEIINKKSSIKVEEI